jgi:YidC/Oxa1 family membrane protein insertase
MEKRIFSAVLISIALLWLWAAVAPKLFPDLMKQARPNTPVKSAVAAKKDAPVQSTAASATAASSTSAPATPVATPAAKPAVAVAPTSARAVELTRVETPDYIATFSNRGAELISFRLTHYFTKPKGGQPVELVKARDPQRSDFPFAIESRDANAAARLNTALFEVANHVVNGSGVLEFRYAGADGLTATKTFHFNDQYLFDFAVSVSPAMPYRVMIGPGLRTLEPDEQDNRFTMTGNGVVQRDDSLKMISREKSDRMNTFGDVQFVGTEDNYFLSVLRPEKAGGAVIRAAEFGAGKDKRRELYAGLNSAPDGTVSGAAFFGPKETTLLDRYGFEKTLQFGTFGIIARFFLVVLQWLNKFTHNWGWAIIILTILIKVVLYPLQHKWMLSMKKIQKVQPKMEAIKAKYRKHRSDPEQRQKMNTEMMKLYQQEGINPAGGCLPMVIQFPIFLGFYNLLSHAIELRGAPFMLWIHDLSAKDPTYVLPILMTIAMFIQQMITPTSADPAQRRMFLIMPIVFGWIFKEFPSGLVVYWLVQNILTIVQQMITNRYYKDHPTATA